MITGPTSKTGKEARKEDEQGDVRDGGHAEPEPAQLDAERPEERQEPVEHDDGGKGQQEGQLHRQRRVPAREVVVLVVVERQREEEGEGQVQEGAARRPSNRRDEMRARLSAIPVLDSCVSV